MGEVALKSDCMLTGYYHRPDATEKAFIDGWYLTGDFGYLVDGELYITGRKKDLIIVGGKNIYPQDLELLAYRSPRRACRACLAFGVFNETTGTEDVVWWPRWTAAIPPNGRRSPMTSAPSVTRGSAVALRYVHLVGQALAGQDLQRQDSPFGQPGEIPEGNAGKGKEFLKEKLY